MDVMNFLLHAIVESRDGDDHLHPLPAINVNAASDNIEMKINLKD